MFNTYTLQYVNNIYKNTIGASVFEINQFKCLTSNTMCFAKVDNQQQTWIFFSKYAAVKISHVRNLFETLRPNREFINPMFDLNILRVLYVIYCSILLIYKFQNQYRQSRRKNKWLQFTLKLVKNSVRVQ